VLLVWLAACATLPFLQTTSNSQGAIHIKTYSLHKHRAQTTAAGVPELNACSFFESTIWCGG
jgi:hypothetical protein